MSGQLKIKKLRSANVGTHHPEQALIFTDSGEIFMTASTKEANGYPLVRFFNHDVLRNAVHQVLVGTANNGVIETTVTNGKLQISPAANCYRVVHYEPGTMITQLEGGYNLQSITIIGQGTPLLVCGNEQIGLVSDELLDTPWKPLVLQKIGNCWKKLF